MDIKRMYETFGISSKVYELGIEIEKKLADRFEQIDSLSELNQIKVLEAFKKNNVSEAHFVKSVGYGYGDLGRDTLESVYADIFKGEDALVRAQLISGTHAISTALFGNLRYGDEMLSPVGKPYDTLDSIIGITPARGSLNEMGITYRQVDLKNDDSFDYDAIREAINARTRLVEIQRSKGYVLRKTFSVEEIGELIRFIKSIKPDVICMVDNCYGEFTEDKEPLEVGADLIVGSLIKNPGGGLAPIGGYIVGKKEYVENAAYRLTAPGLGKEIGANLGVMKDLYQGIFQSPSIVASATKAAIFAAAVYEKIGFEVLPTSDEPRHDIIQALILNSPEAMAAFCEGIQSVSPVDAYVKPEASEMPGYDDKVIGAGGTFISGSSIELSADGPVRPPYAIFMQGGLTWAHAKLGVLMSVQKLMDYDII